MALLRTSTVWTGSAGSPYFTQNYFLGAGDATHATSCITALWTFLGAIASYIDDALVESISGDVEVIDVASGQILNVHSVTGAVQGGTATGDALPTLCQGLLRLNTGAYVAGRQLKGRMYLPGMMESNNTVVGLPSAGMIGAINTAAATFIASAADPAVYSHTHSYATSVNSATLSPKWSYLRTRRD